ncbi:hypothetical protein VMCG_07636 [Cytospora schulzeri]|uniref:NmrA-like domain-containing protein n=1 Tax=Cytospora schulzeri TaxID=448051 RepID=A0A423VXE1_9PEZI|nr:hypothetical protein VMCG_07636 [Valsa malicola]
MDTTTTPTVFVAGATGSVGGAVSRQMRQLGWSVNAITRDVESHAARSLMDIGVSLVQGDWDDAEVLEQQFRGVDMLFLLMSSSTRPGFKDAQVEQARNILRIARCEGVKKVVYMSAMGCNDLDNWGVTWDAASPMTTSMRSKQAIESIVRASDFPSGYTILRPGFFMANFIGTKAAGYTASGVWKTALRPDTELPMVDHEDIARFAVAAFQDPERFRGAEITLFSELRKPGVLTETLSGAIGKRLEVSFMSEQDTEKDIKSPFVMAQVAMRNMARFVGDGAPGTKWAVEMTGFEDFLQREKQALRDTYADLNL